MVFLRKWLAALVLGLVAITVSAAPQSGLGYSTLETPQTTDTGKKVEVIEFFGYWCSHCYSFDPFLKSWAKKQGNNIVFKRVAVGFNDAMRPQQKMFYTLSAMGKLDSLHSKIFNAVQVEGLPLRRDEQVFDFITKNGVDRNKFIEIYNSPSIESLTQSAGQLQSLFKIDGVLTIAIDGRYITSPSMVAGGVRMNMSEAELQAAALKVMDGLVAKVRQEKNLDEAPAKSKRNKNAN